MASVTNRYARAFADVVFEMKLDAQQTIQELRSMVNVVSSSHDLRRIWDNPSVPAEQKRRLLDAISEKLGVGRIVRNFIAVLIDHRRIAALNDIARQVELELDHRLGFTEAQVRSARELLPAEKQALEQKIEWLSGKKVRADYCTDRALLGGAVVKVGSTIYDGSVRGQLERLKEELSS